MKGEVALRRARLLAALRIIAAAQERYEGGGRTSTTGLDRLREDIAAALQLLEIAQNGR
jgi:hypothetical protein